MTTTSLEPIVIYLLHFGAPVQTKRHYIGSAKLKLYTSRLRAHSEGRGAALTRAAQRSGVPFAVGRVWITDSRELEFKLKWQGHARDLCLVCSGEVSPLYPPKKNSRPVSETMSESFRSVEY